MRLGPILIASALTAGAASAAGLSGMPSGVVEVPCYPDNRFELCPVPAVEVHAPGYLPRTVPSESRLFRDGNGFQILVTPNIVPYELAVRRAASAAAAHCGIDGPNRIVARIDERERYSDLNLGSWQFGGHCE